MQKLAEICIRRPVFATMIIMALVVTGAAAYLGLGVDRFPAVDIPQVRVRATLPGSAPEEMETEVAQRLEEAVNTVEGLDELRSISGQGSSVVIVTFELERMHGAWIDGTIAGGAGAFTFDFSVPGGTMPCAGVTVVGVYPQFRRRGVLTALMRAQLDDVRERGEPIAALWASEERIYPRFGYGMASLAGEIALSRERAGFALPYAPVGRIRLVEPDEAKALREKGYPAFYRHGLINS